MSMVSLLASINYTVTQVSPGTNPSRYLESQTLSYMSEVETFPYYICEDILKVWLTLLEPRIDYTSDTRPPCWPPALPFKKPRLLYKAGTFPSLNE